MAQNLIVEVPSNTEIGLNIQISLVFVWTEKFCLNSGPVQLKLWILAFICDSTYPCGWVGWSFIVSDLKIAFTSRVCLILARYDSTKLTALYIPLSTINNPIHTNGGCISCQPSRNSIYVHCPTGNTSNQRINRNWIFLCSAFDMCRKGQISTSCDFDFHQEQLKIFRKRKSAAWSEVKCESSVKYWQTDLQHCQEKSN